MSRKILANILRHFPLTTTRMNPDENYLGVLSRAEKFTLGIFVLLLVDFIWVGSSELTKFLYKSESYEKPLFTTYVKTSMFSIYLLGFLVWSPWREMCMQSQNAYVIMENDEENYPYDLSPTLSEPAFVPLRKPERNGTGSRSSGTESDDASARSVRFSKLAEVRQMSEDDASAAFLARLSYNASVRATRLARQAANKLPINKVAWLSFTFSILWCIANYSYQASLEYGEPGLVSLLSCTSPLFTLILSALFPSSPSDKLTASKISAVILCLIGAATVCWSNLGSNFPLGASLSLIGALFYAIYIVMLKKKLPSEDSMDIPMFFGFVGIFCLFGLWPLLPTVHAIGIEKFQWPNKEQWMVLLLNGLVGTVLSEVLWLWGCLLTSPLIGTLALTLTVPMTILADSIIWQTSYPIEVYLGSIPMLIALIWASLLSSPRTSNLLLQDDLYDCCVYKIWRRIRRDNVSVIHTEENEQTESLIGDSSSINNNEEET